MKNRNRIILGVTVFIAFILILASVVVFNVVKQAFEQGILGIIKPIQKKEKVEAIPEDLDSIAKEINLQLINQDTIIFFIKDDLDSIRYFDKTPRNSPSND